jgi:hypothetical protein
LPMPISGAVFLRLAAISLIVAGQRDFM